MEYFENKKVYVLMIIVYIVLISMFGCTVSERAPEKPFIISHKAIILNNTEFSYYQYYDKNGYMPPSTIIERADKYNLGDTIK